ncbi:MAG: penicillin-binding protein 2, partial [Acidobacteria bacterium]|nr:penicillin-binding protein 2 [Acidobacteriota bacterium]
MSGYSEERRYTRDVETAVFQYVAAFLFLWLLTGFWQLQVKEPEIYEERAARNRVRALPVLAPRGKLLDRDGRVLVDNWPAFKVMLSRDELNMDSLPLIAEGLNIPYERLRERLEEIRDEVGPEYRQIILKESLTPTEVAFLDAHRAELPELELLRSPRRLYPRDGRAAHVTGYVGQISESELEEDEFALYESGAEIGKAGIEREYNDALTGTDGSKLVLVDSRSRRVRDLDLVEAKPGRSVRLTLDLDVQSVAELAMDGRRGGLVALDPRSGEVLAMVSTPRFDPNRFVGGISAGDWTALTEDPDYPLLNRSIQAQRAPGSIFKPIVAWAALDSGVVDRSFKVHCGGGASFFGRFFRCHRAGGHGWV